MFDPNRPYRSMLFSPAANTRALAKIGSLACDGVIIDLEDAVDLRHKEQARKNLIGFSATHARASQCLVLARVNAVGSRWIADDLSAAVAAGVDGIVLPKVRQAADLDHLGAQLDALGARDTPVWAMIETPQAVINLSQICTACPGLAGLILGPNDLTKELGAQATPDRAALAYSLGAVVLAARAFGLICLDGVYNSFRDTEGFLADCEQGRLYGFDGKTLIHPDQIAGANTVFAPSAADVAQARRKIEAFDTAQVKGAGLAVLDGEMIEELHVQSARAVLEKHRTIIELEKDRVIE